MSSLKIVIAILLLLTLEVLAKYVIELPTDDLERRIDHYEICPVLFFAPFDGESETIASEFETAAEMSARSSLQIIFAKVNCEDDNDETCQKFEIEGQTTIKIFRYGNYIEDYEGPMNAKNMLKTVKVHIDGVAKELTGEDELKKFLGSEGDTGAILGVFAEDTDLKKAFLDVSDQLRRQFKFAYVTQSELIPDLKYNDAVIVYRPAFLYNIFEENNATLVGETTKDDLKNFIQQNYFGLVGHRKMDNMNYFKDPLVVVYYKIDYEMNKKNTNYWRNRVLKVAKIYSDQFTFAISDTDEYEEELGDANIAEDSNLPVVIAKNIKGQKFIMKNQFSFDSLNQFIEDILTNKLEPHVKSQPIPLEEDGFVRQVVAQNFEEVIMNSPKDIFLEFYAPWCGHCKKVALTLETLAEKLLHEDVDIVKMDATENDVPSPYQIDGYPTFYWLGKNAKDTPKKYEGDGKLDAFLKYIAKEATEELMMYDRKGKLKVEKDEL